MHEKEGVFGEAGFYLSKYKRREVETSLLLIESDICFDVGVNYINWNCIPMLKLSVVTPPVLSPE